MMKRTVTALAAAALLALGAAPADAQEPPRICITYDFAGSELCPIEEVQRLLDQVPSAICIPWYKPPYTICLS